MPAVQNKKLVSPKFIKWAIENSKFWSGKIENDVYLTEYKLHVKWFELRYKNIIIVLRGDWKNEDYSCGSIQLIFLDAPKEDNEYDLYSPNIIAKINKSCFNSLWKLADIREPVVPKPGEMWINDTT